MTDSGALPLKRHLSDKAESPIPRKRSKSPVWQDRAPPKKDFAEALAEAKVRAAQLKKGQPSAGTTANGASQASRGAPAAGSASGTALSSADRLAQLRARVNKAIGKPAVPEDELPLPSSVIQDPKPTPTPLPRARGGLDIGLHPALLASQKPGLNAVSSKRPTVGGKKGKRSGTQAAAADDDSNPYFEAPADGKVPTTRPIRPLVFNEKGKYIAQADALRRQAAFEDMKKRIAQSTRKAGINEDADVERNFLVPEPPEVEWWDEGLLTTPNYDSLDDLSTLKIDTADSPITLYIQHPVQIEPPQDKTIGPPKPMYRTAKENAKVRRQRRLEDMKEQQAKIRLGLVPAPPPKVKKSNLMRVLGEEAVKDPTAVEARVNREIQERLETHLHMNEERKLTKEQRAEKAVAQQERDEAKGVQVAVYKIDNLSNGQHRFKISKNAEQNALTGICVITPKMSVVITEGGGKGVNAFKKLMLRRIDWTENSPSRAVVDEAKERALAQWLKAEDEQGDLKDLTLNRCSLVFEGEEKRRAYKKWGVKVCETDADARSFLERYQMGAIWTRAKSQAHTTS